MKLFNYLFIAALVVGCTAKGNVEEKAPPSYPVLEIAIKDTSLNNDYVASIEAVKNVEIRARVQGYLNNIFIDEGQLVKKGQSLFQLDQTEYDIAVAKAKATVINAVADAKGAEVELKRVQTLLSKNIVSPSELELAEAKLNAAKALIEEAKSAQRDAETKLSYTHIRSPFDGIINRFPLKSGSLVDVGALLTTISEHKEVYAYFNVSENEYLKYKQTPKEERNDVVSLILADGTTYAHPGKIETVEGEFDESTGSIAFRAKFANPEKLLKHGATGKVRLQSHPKPVIIVPQKSVFEIQDKNYVFVVTEDHTVKMRNVIPETRVANTYIIQSGLKEGDVIMYEGVQNVKEGEKIQPVMVSLGDM